MITKTIHLSPNFSIVSVHDDVRVLVDPKGNIIKNRTKRVGPRMDPWGTPERTGRKVELDPPTTTACFLSLR